MSGLPVTEGQCELVAAGGAGSASGFAGRSATPQRSSSLRTPSSQEFGQVTIVSEERHELSDHSAMSVHQVRIELPVDVDADRVVVLAEHWGGVHR